MPDRAPVAVAHLRAETTGWADELGAPTDRLLLGGRSYGGRMCSMAVAEGLPAAGLVLLSYPLHPPGRPEKLRVEHFGQIDVPTLFVSGDRDPFGTPDELAEHVAAIPGPVTTVTLSGAHDMRGAVRQKDVADAVATWVTSL
jgi:predicted alpha/beta-hydrolase family hydrolase